MVAILIIKGCKYKSLRTWLAQQQLSPNTVCAYPVTVNTALEMIKKGQWIEDHRMTGTGTSSNRRKKKDKDKTDRAVGRIIHNEEDTQEEAVIMKHVLVMVDSNSNAVECHNSFDPI